MESKIKPIDVKLSDLFIADSTKLRTQRYVYVRELQSYARSSVFVNRLIES